jgi:predicted ArsR family transcriptional regulator
MDRQSVAAIAALDDDVRRALFACVRDAPGPVTREAAAASVGISRKLAAFHLDKLVDAGLLEARIEAVGAPRVGRAPKVYEPAERDVAVCVPQREPALLAEILLSAISDELPAAEATGAVLRAARGRGEQEGRAVRESTRPGRLGVERATGLVEELLAERGFEPVRDGDAVRLRNCPFHPLVESAPEVVCGLNHAYLCGVLCGLGADTTLDATLEPAPGRCCVAFRPR